MNKQLNYRNTKYILILSLLSALVMGLMILFVYHVAVPNPNMILIIVLILFTGIGGWIPGAVSAVMILLYSMFFFSTDHSFFSYTGENAQKIIIILIGDLCCYLVVSLLKYNRDRNHLELAKSNEALKEANQALETQAEADAKIAELSRSVNSLLTNMPALTFSKDIASGRYLACNQLFAEYAHKENPQGVVGLTDHEIFDQNTADHFVKDDKIALSMDAPYIFFEDVPDAVGNPRHFQTTKQKFYDEQGRLCTLGMCVDVTELVNMKREKNQIREEFEKSRYESLIYSHIARSLSADYTFVYYVDVENDEYVEYRSVNKEAPLSLVVKSHDFFGESHKNAQTAIYEADREDFLSAFTKENIMDTLDRQGLFNLTYRLMIDGKPNYVNMKVNRTREDPRHIVIGVMNIDAEMKVRREANRIREERRAFTRISALSGDYIVIYSVDPETCHYDQYSANAQYEDLNIEKSGEDFFAVSRKNARHTVYQGDQERFTTMFTRTNVLREIHEKGLFTLKYRLVLERRPIYVRLKATIVEEDSGKRLLVGILNITEQVRQDQEYEYHIETARILANRDELTGVKNKHAYAQTERELNQQIEGREPVEFALVVFDVNGLKSVNDQHGHIAGDEYLKQACSLICKTFKHSPVFRVGGDEFVVISRGSDYQDIDTLVARIAEQNRISSASDGVVIACGMARYTGEYTLAEVFAKADRLMYENKEHLKSLTL